MKECILNPHETPWLRSQWVGNVQTLSKSFQNVLRLGNVDNIYVHFHLINSDCQHSPKVKDILRSNKQIGKLLQIKPSTPAF